MSEVSVKIVLAAAMGLLLLVSIAAQTRPQQDKSLSRSVAAINVRDSGAKIPSVSNVIPAPINDPTCSYHIGVGDTIRIEIKDIPGPPKYAKVLSDGRIDFPLGSQNLLLAGKTIAEAETGLAESIKLIANAQVLLKVSNFSSHTVSFWGLVNQTGEQQIQRDAVPLYVIQAMAGVDKRAKWARITHGKSRKSVIVPINEPSFDQTLVYPGDSIEFTDRDIVDK